MATVTLPSTKTSAAQLIWQRRTLYRTAFALNAFPDPRRGHIVLFGGLNARTQIVSMPATLGADLRTGLLTQHMQVPIISSTAQRDLR
ncbi:hypothetical protein DFR70_11145 [Nocardia tenerifensis]|uniref:Uncharacterized protein n=1 Tax=Nocardia tenerifensis TaxID=228006 RepID=A0A318JXB3_9NOCA|nr:hypothetical protein [Nocardia tenerifensis]PXX59663.1 hypothetical protein DFR70_11145 [Nocardia tenerifensis]